VPSVLTTSASSESTREAIWLVDSTVFGIRWGRSGALPSGSADNQLVPYGPQKERDHPIANSRILRPRRGDRRDMSINYWVISSGRVPGL
jgi:hypothetical protein